MVSYAEYYNPNIRINDYKNIFYEIILYNNLILDEAIFNYKTALAIKRDYPEAYFNLGNALSRKIEMFKNHFFLDQIILEHIHSKMKKADPSLQSYILESFEI